MALPLILFLVLIGIGLICLGKYAATPPLDRWSFGAGVFFCAVALVMVLWNVIVMAGGGAVFK